MSKPDYETATIKKCQNHEGYWMAAFDWPEWEEQISAMKDAFQQMWEFVKELVERVKRVWDSVLQAFAKYIGKPRWYHLYKNAKTQCVRLKYCRLLNRELLLFLWIGRCGYAKMSD